MNFLYILQSLKDNRYYVGITSNLENRLSIHNNGYVRSTKNRIPFKIVYSESFKTRAEARAREKHFKSYKGSREKLSILENL
ncbi:MAG: GIY-YIG nuclease family protein [Parcubacteria group bacterium]|nr:GIY-YIG nuclease family protein [Parcubacteria group bacterium]